MATPPWGPPRGPGGAGLWRRVAAGNAVSQRAASARLQCVSCSRTARPASSHRRMMLRLKAAWSVWGDTSQRGFQVTRVAPVSMPWSARRSSRSSKENCWRPAHVAPRGGGQPWSSNQRDEAERMWRKHPRRRSACWSPDRARRHAGESAMGRNREGSGRPRAHCRASQESSMPLPSTAAVFGRYKGPTSVGRRLRVDVAGQ